MLQLLGVMITVALADSMNPSTIGPALYLATIEHGLRQVLLFATGVFGVSLLGGVLFVFGPGHAILSLVPKPGETLRYWLELVVGMLLVIGAGFTWRRRHALVRRGLPKPKEGGKSGLVLGITIMAVELPTAFPYIGVLAADTSSRLSDAQQLLLLVIYNLVFVLPLLAIALALVVLGPRAEPALLRTRGLLERYWPQALAWILGVLGVIVVALGSSGLVSQGNGSLSRHVRHVRQFITHP